MVAPQKILRLVAAAAMTWEFASFWIGWRGIPIPQAATYLSYATTERTPLNSDTPRRCPTRGRREKNPSPQTTLESPPRTEFAKKKPRRNTVCHFKELTAWNSLRERNPKDPIFGEFVVSIAVRRKRSGSSSPRNLIERERRRPPPQTITKEKGKKANPACAMWGLEVSVRESGN